MRAIAHFDKPGGGRPLLRIGLVSLGVLAGALSAFASGVRLDATVSPGEPRAPSAASARPSAEIAVPARALESAPTPAAGSEPAPETRGAETRASETPAQEISARDAGTNTSTSTDADALRERSTPLTDEAAAAHLAQAYAWLTGNVPSERSLSILWAHWAHETARGRRMQGHNFAGLKGSGPDGDSVVTWTRERNSSLEPLVLRSFRAYADEIAGARDYLTLLGQRYPRALKALQRGSELDFVSALERGGYFTDDPARYLRALTSLAAECRRRKVAERALHEKTALDARSDATARVARDDSTP